jgi:hypothetical protein
MEYTDGKETDPEEQSVVTESGRYRQSDTEQHRHRGQHHEPDAAFVDVDRARQPGVTGPGPPDRSEHKQATKNSVPGRVVDQEARDLRDREHEDEVEEKLERCDLVLVAACRLALGIRACRLTVGCASGLRLVWRRAPSPRTASSPRPPRTSPAASRRRSDRCRPANRDKAWRYVRPGVDA